ncbi:MAG: zinc ribbon domain-containing protein [Defluviitaleaceae bacterium]|nr:zinc ribbon domain-containing protein [Defluviitaleaceae bacterium]
MPNYDLHCKTCNTDHNIRASMAEKAEKRIPCPSCGSFEMETLFKAAPAYVKGSAAVVCPQRNNCAGCPNVG